MDQVNHDDGLNYSTYALPILESIHEYTGGEYVDISMEYDIKNLVEIVNS